MLKQKCRGWNVKPLWKVSTDNIVNSWIEFAWVARLIAISLSTNRTLITSNDIKYTAKGNGIAFGFVWISQVNIFVLEMTQLCGIIFYLTCM